MARTRFGELMDEVDADQVRFVVSRRGKAKVVILSVRGYLGNVIKQPDLLTNIQVSAPEAGLAKLPEAEIDTEVRLTGSPSNVGCVLRTLIRGPNLV